MRKTRVVASFKRARDPPPAGRCSKRVIHRGSGAPRASACEAQRFRKRRVTSAQWSRARFFQRFLTRRRGRTDARDRGRDGDRRTKRTARGRWSRTTGDAASGDVDGGATRCFFVCRRRRNDQRGAPRMRSRNGRRAARVATSMGTTAFYDDDDEIGVRGCGWDAARERDDGGNSRVF